MGNFIQITDSLAIKSDRYQWMVCKYQSVKVDGEDTDSWKPFIFCGGSKTDSGLSSAVKAAGEHMLRTGDAQNADELLVLANNISALLNQKFTASFDIKIKEKG